MSRRRSLFRRRHALVWLVAGLVLAIAAGLIIFGLFDGPATGAPGTAPIPVTTGDDFNNLPTLVNGSYADFAYPSAFTVASTTTPTSPLLAAYHYGYTTSGHNWNLAISINRLHDASLEADNSYQLRQTQSGRYAESRASYGGQLYPVMTDTQATGFSQVVYLLHGNMSADIALSGYEAPGVNDLENTLSQIINSWQWK